MSKPETIFALSTAPGKSGIAIIRVSGINSFNSLKKITGQSTLPKNRTATLRTLYNTDSRETTPANIIDRAIVITFKAPDSFTGEDVVEYHIHGSIAVIDELIDRLSTFENHRLAEPGEFTRRAFENNRIDLTAAEAIGDLITAETQAQKIQAIAQMEGSLSNLYNEWSNEILKTLAYIESSIDFTEEEIPQEEITKQMENIKETISRIEEHLNDNNRGQRLRNGIHIAVIGAPNAGKSSLVNTLAKRDIAIVSDTAGTTRDIIETHLDLSGYPAIISDTAGLRPEQLEDGNAQNSIESEGIKRALKKAKTADIKLLLFNASDPEPDKNTTALIDKNSLIVINKTDTIQNNHEELKNRYQQLTNDPIFISVKTGQGIKTLTNTLSEKIKSMIGNQEAPSLTRKRHRNALEECKTHLNNALTQTQTELIAENLRLALRSIDRITGKTDVEDLLDVIFSDFCIGK